MRAYRDFNLSSGNKSLSSTLNAQMSMSVATNLGVSGFIDPYDRRNRDLPSIPFPTSNLAPNHVLQSSAASTSTASTDDTGIAPMQVRREASDTNMSIYRVPSVMNLPPLCISLSPTLIYHHHSPPLTVIHR
jgi:hypothetical protein